MPGVVVRRGNGQVYRLQNIALIIIQLEKWPARHWYREFGNNKRPNVDRYVALRRLKGGLDATHRAVECRDAALVDGDDVWSGFSDRICAREGAPGVGRLRGDRCKGNSFL